MVKYIFRRLLYFIPTLVVISLLTFFISINAPGDPVEVMLGGMGGGEGQSVRNTSREKDYAELRHRLGLDLPLFYFSLTDATVSDTLHRISRKKYREQLKRLSNEYGNWENITAYFEAVKNLDQQPAFKNVSQNMQLLKIRSMIDYLLELKIDTSTGDTINKIASMSVKASDSILPPVPATCVKQLQSAYGKVLSEKNEYRKYIPAIHWYGLNNQYHRWATNFITGDFGISYRDKRPVRESLFESLARTVGISLLSILLAYGIAIPLGIHSAVKKGTGKEKTITTTLFILYSLPNFWIATMLVIFLCGGDYFSWFPAPGSQAIPDEAPFWYKLSEGAYRLILPLFCWTYGSLAFISRQMRGGILSNITQDYIQTARAKGLDENEVIRKHALKNSLLPVITLFASIFPLAISGSFVIETIFQIPGMGKLSLEALYARDYPVIFTVMMFTALLTLLGNLVADILYAFVDPRISYDRNTA